MPGLDTTVCRVCLQRKGTDALNSNKFQYCTMLKMPENDGLLLPQKLCRKCSDNLRVAYDFRYQATCAQQHFDNILKEIKEAKIEEQLPEINSSEDAKIGVAETHSEGEILVADDDDDGLSDHFSDEEFQAPNGTTTDADDAAHNLTDKQAVSEFQRDLGSMLLHKGKIECNICGRIKASIHTLKAHFLSHSGLRPFRCTVCNKRFLRHCILKNHMRLHTGNMRHVCDVCGAAFASKVSMMRHKIRDHDSNRQSKRKYTCALCHIEHPSKYALKGHMRSHLKQLNEDSLKPLPALNRGEGEMGLYQKASVDELPRFVCIVSDCDDSFERKYQLLAHLQSHNGAENLTQQCLSDPSTEYLEEMQMKRAPLGNNVSNSNAKAPSYSCDCNKTFARKCALDLHRQMHGNHKPYNCLLCTHTQCTIADLKAHMRTAHNSEYEGQHEMGVTNYKCGLCGLNFYLLSGYVHHLDRHIRGDPFYPQVETMNL